MPGRPFRGFTSARLPPPPEAEVLPTQLDKIVSRVIALVDPLVGEGWHQVCVVDDLELVNRDQPDVVLRVAREAFERALWRLHRRDPRRAALIRGALRRKASVHVIRPMVEAWFFGAPSIFQRDGVRFDARFHIVGGDPEAFESTDRDYIAATEAQCPEWCLRRRKRGDRPKWLGADRVHHPKGYLQWLMRDGAHKACTAYDEAHGGAEALAGLDWAALLDGPRDAPFARALVEDIADGLGQPPALAAWAGITAPETSVKCLPCWPVLRNL